MVKDFIFMRMGLNTLGFGKMISNTVEEKKPGLTDLVFRVII